MIFTKNPMKPIIRKPKPVARAILANSAYIASQCKTRWWRCYCSKVNSISLTFVVRFGALLDQICGVFDELSERLDDKGVDVGHVTVS